MNDKIDDKMQTRSNLNTKTSLPILNDISNYNINNDNSNNNSNDFNRLDFDHCFGDEHDHDDKTDKLC